MPPGPCSQEDKHGSQWFPTNKTEKSTSRELRKIFPPINGSKNNNYQSSSWLNSELKLQSINIMKHEDSWWKRGKKNYYMCIELNLIIWTLYLSTQNSYQSLQFYKHSKQIRGRTCSKLRGEWSAHVRWPKLPERPYLRPPPPRLQELHLVRKADSVLRCLVCPATEGTEMLGPCIGRGVMCYSWALLSL